MENAPAIAINLPEITTDLESLAVNWTKYLEVSKSTREAYQKGIRIFLSHLKKEGIQRPDRETIINWRDALKDKIKPTTLALYLASIRRFFGWLESEGLYPDISRKLKTPKLQRLYRKDPLTAAQAKEIVEAIDTTTLKGLRDVAIISLMVTAGLRDIEVVRANADDIRIAGGSSVLYIQGKGREEKDEYVKLAPFVEQRIRLWQVALARPNPHGPLFCSLSNRDFGDRLTTRSISRIVKTALRSVGLNSDRLTAHSLRHTTATLNLLQGGTLQETQQLLRHNNITTTMIYNHSLERAANNSELRVSQAIFG